MIVGRDCDGKPLYVGDKVELLGLLGPTIPGKIGFVIGEWSEGERRIRLDVQGRRSIASKEWMLRKITNDDKSDWAETEKATGWKPVRECA